MTIHKSKGLEFDVVILPHLERQTKADNHPLLIWQEQTEAHGHSELLLAPIKRSEQDRIYDFLRHQENKKAKHESARLLYVAVTRAKQQLHLLGSVKRHEDPEKLLCKPNSGSLLERLWDTVAAFYLNSVKTSAATTLAPAMLPAGDHSPRLVRLSPDWSSPSPMEVALKHQQRPTSPRFYWQINDAKHIGTVIHRWLQQLSLIPLEKWPDIQLQRPTIKILLLNLGVIREHSDAAADTVIKALNYVMQDPKGRWLLKHDHSHSASEFAISAQIGDSIQHLVLDRTFVDNDTRWIIDYKSVQYQGDDLKTFVNQEIKRYQLQLEQYAQALQNIDHRPIRLGLYFPLLRAFHEWAFVNTRPDKVELCPPLLKID